MNFGSVALKGLVVLILLILLSLARAITFPPFSVLTNTAGAGIVNLLLLLAALLVLSIVGTLLARGIKSVKKSMEALLFAFVGSFFMGAILAVFALLNIPYAARVNLSWLGTSWYSPILTLFFIGVPLMLVFLVGD